MISKWWHWKTIQLRANVTVVLESKQLAQFEFYAALYDKREMGGFKGKRAPVTNHKHSCIRMIY